MIVDLHAHFGRWFFPTFADDPRAVSRLCDTFGIEKAVFSSSLAITYKMETGNRELARFLTYDPRFYGYIYVNPSRPQDSKREIHTYIQSSRFVGVKLHPSHSSAPADSPQTVRLLEALPEGKLVLVHTWGVDGVGQTCRLASKLPQHRFIMGHMGGTTESGWRAAIRESQGLPNVWLEICGSLLHYDRIAEAVDTLGPARIVFGSDMTLISPAFALGQVLDAAIPQSAKRMILRENALKLLAGD